MKGLSLLFFLAIFGCAKAQMPYSAYYLQALGSENGSPIFGDSSKLTDPQKATYFALIPGGGQIYNKKYFKAGIVYAGFAGLIYFNKISVDSLRKYEIIYADKIDGDTIDGYPQFSTSSAKFFRDNYRRNRDVSILGFVGLYAIQIIDANVDAHLKEFKVNDELSMRITPALYAIEPGIGRYNGVSIKLRF